MNHLEQRYALPHTKLILDQFYSYMLGKKNGECLLNLEIQKNFDKPLRQVINKPWIQALRSNHQKMWSVYISINTSYEIKKPEET